MKFSCAFPIIAVIASIIAGCQAMVEATSEPSIVFARAETGERLYHVQTLNGGQPPTRLALPRLAGNLQTAPRASIVAATIGGEGTGSAELRLLSLESTGAIGAGGQVLATEWAWDFALRDDGGAIAWVAGQDRRQLFVARAPEWKPALVTLPREATPGGPRWIDPRGLLVVSRAANRNELLALSLDTGESRVVHRAPDGATLSDACRVPGSDDVLVVEMPDAAVPGKLLRVALTGGEPRVLATGFFLPGTIAVSPNGRHIAAVSSVDLVAVQRREAALRWIGDPWRGAPAAVPEVTSLAWSPDGTQLAVARQRDGRRWIEVYSERAAQATPRTIGFEDALCFAPQWWQPRTQTP